MISPAKISPLTEDLIARIERYCARTGVSEEAFGKLAAYNRNLLTRLRNDRTITLRTYERIDLFLRFDALSRVEQHLFLEQHEASIQRWLTTRSAS
jgi:hypothetical protein